MKKKTNEFLEIVPFVILTFIAVILSLKGINCGKGLSWRTCNFFEGIITFFEWTFIITVPAFILFIVGIIRLIKNMKK